MANISLKSLMEVSVTPKLEKLVKKTLGSKVSITHFKDKTFVVSPGGFFRPSQLQSMADDLLKVIPKNMLDNPVGSLEPVRVGTGGATEGQIIIKLK
jgi:hypothetical protein